MVGHVEEEAAKEKKVPDAERPTANLVDLVVKNDTLRVPCGSRITRLIADRKKLSLTLWPLDKLLKGKNKAAAKEKTLIGYFL